MGPAETGSVATSAPTVAPNLSATMVATLTNRAVTTILVASANQNISSGAMKPISANSDSLHFAKPGRTEEPGVLNHDSGMSAPDQQRQIDPVPTANPKRLTASANRLILAADERSLQVDLVRFDRNIPAAGCVASRDP